MLIPLHAACTNESVACSAAGISWLFESFVATVQDTALAGFPVVPNTISVKYAFNFPALTTFNLYTTLWFGAVKLAFRPVSVGPFCASLFIVPATPLAPVDALNTCTGLVFRLFTF